MDGMITLMVHLQAKSGKADELEAALQDLVVNARQEEGCVDFHFHRGVDDPNHFAFYENWRSQKDFDTHLQQPIQGEFAKISKPLLAKDIDLQFYEMRSPFDR
jgi:quinol monooxygenase YgiN